MRRSAPGSIDGLEPDIRETAREAARRQGLSLGEWLNDAVLAQAADLGVDIADMGADERLEAVTARLHRLDGREPRRPRNTRLRRPLRDEEDDDIAPRYASDEEDNDPDARRRASRRMPERPRPVSRVPEARGLDAEALLDAAVEAFEQTAAKTHRQTAQSIDAMTKLIQSQKRSRQDDLGVLADISDRLGDIEAEIKRRADAARKDAEPRFEPHVEHKPDPLPAVAQRLADIEAHLSQKVQEDSFKPIKNVLSRLEARLDAVAQKPAPAPAAPPRDDADLKRLEGKLDALLRSSALSPPQEEPRRPAPRDAELDQRPVRKALWRNSLESAIAEIGQTQRLLNGEPEFRPVARRGDRPFMTARTQRHEAPRPADMQPLQSEIAALGAKIEAMRLQDLAQDLDRIRTDMGAMSAGMADLAPRGSVSALEAAIQNLTARIETSREDGMREQLLKPIKEVAADLRQSLGSMGSAPAIGKLEREIKSIGEKLDAIAKAPHDPEVLAKLQDQVGEIHELLTAAAAHSFPIEKIEEKIASLAAHIDRQRVLDGERFGALAVPRDDLPPAQAASVTAFPGLEQDRLDTLIKIEDRLDDLSGKLEKVMNVRPAPSPQMDAQSLEALVHALSDKFAAAQTPDAGHQAFNALQQQISELAQRLERSDSGFATLNLLQRSVGELSEHFDEARFSANDSAVTAARDAAREAVRELLERNGGLMGKPGDEAITREIADLRSVHDQADRRTHSTLNAVHETLEKIVDRLAMLEEEIGEAQEAAAQAVDTARRTTPSMPQARPLQMPNAAQIEREVRLHEDALGARGGHGAADDFLIEPGSLFPKAAPAPAAKGAAPAARAAELDTPARNRADFIAAARRAAQAAQADVQQDTARPRLAIPETRQTAPHAGLVEQTRGFLANHKRRLTLSVAALFLAVGAYALVKTMGHTVDVSYDMSKTAAAYNVADARADQARGERKADPRAVQPAAAAPVASPAVPAVPPAAKDDVQAKAEPMPASLPLLASGIGRPQQPKPIAGSDPIVVGTITSKGLPAETPAAAAALREQADAGNPAAQFELASRYAEGRTVPRDLKLAADWFEKAAQRGLAPAQYRLGSLYEKGMGVTRDLPRARDWYEKAAAQGHSHAMHNLAVLTAEGSDGKPDYAASAIWFRKAAELGIRDSQYNLAILYARGLGVPQDLAQSYAWFAIAAAQGDEDAGRKREDVAARLDAKALSQAKAAAAAFQPHELDRAANEVQVPPGGWEAVPTPANAKNLKPKISRL